MKKYIIIGSVALIILIISTYYYFTNQEQEIIEEEITIEEVKEEVVTNILCVDIKGAINKPDVYCLEEGNRILDAIDSAGGLKSTADTSVINLSKKIKDEMTIIIYTKTQIKDAIKKLQSTPTIIEIIKEIEKECVCPDVNDACINQPNEDTSTLININSANKAQLMTLTGVGESKADAIITYRSNTPFTIIDDIKNVPGIGDSIFESLREYITV